MMFFILFILAFFAYFVALFCVHKISMRELDAARTAEDFAKVNDNFTKRLLKVVIVTVVVWLILVVVFVLF